MQIHRHSVSGLILILWASCVLGFSGIQQYPTALSIIKQGADLPNVTYSGYVPVSKDGKDALFYAYYEAQEAAGTHETPILLWLEVLLHENASFLPVTALQKCFRLCMILDKIVNNSIT